MGIDKRRRHGTGHLYQRGQTWWIAFHANGKLVRESAKTSSKAEASRKLRAKLAGVDAGTITAESRNVALSDLERLVVDDYRINGRKTAAKVAATFGHLKEYFGEERKVREITNATVEAFKAARLDAGAKAATVNRDLASLRRGFRLAIRHGLIATRPDFSLITENNARKGFFEDEQFEALVGHLPEWLAPLAKFLFLLGWRRREASSLQWRAIDRRAKMIRIEESKTGARTVPYRELPQLVDLVEQQWKTHEDLRRNGVVCPFVFNRDGREIKDFRGAWVVACAAAGLAGKVPHDFRRTAARNFSRAGVPESVIMALCGWRTRSVFDRYRIVSERDLAEGLGKLAKARS